jgi:hypothetical protein
MAFAGFQKTKKPPEYVFRRQDNHGSALAALCFRLLALRPVFSNGLPLSDL